MIFQHMLNYRRGTVNDFHWGFTADPYIDLTFTLFS